MSCKIDECERDAENGYCKYHKLAYNNLLKGYEEWKIAIGNISWDDYLTQLSDNDKTGEWVMDIILHELKEKENIK